jgi:hypothetical protein
VHDPLVRSRSVETVLALRDVQETFSSFAPAS